MRDVSLPGKILAPVCLVVITLILLLLVLHKAYTSTLQRLFLYLIIFNVIQEACLIVAYATQFEYSEHKKFCDAINIFWQWSNTVGYLLIFAIIVFLPYKIYERFKGDPFPRLTRSKCCLVALKCLFVFIVLVLPLAYILPVIILLFANCGYLPQLCRVSLTSILVGNCTITQIVIANLAPGYIVGLIDFIGAFVIIIVLSVVFCCLSREYREARITLRRTLILLAFFVVYTIISIVLIAVLFGILTKLDTLKELLSYLEVLLVVIAAILPVDQLIFPLAFLYYLYSYNLFHWRAIKRAAAEWRYFRSCCERENSPQEAATAPGSHHVMVPSVTFFDVPHSRVTTDVTNDFHQMVVAEDTAL